MPNANWANNNNALNRKYYKNQEIVVFVISITFSEMMTVTELLIERFQSLWLFSSIQLLQYNSISI